MPGWWIYENRPHDKAIMHYWECSHCRDGEGKNKDSSHEHDAWHGPYASEEEATKTARTLGRGETRTCYYCGSRVK